MPQIKVILLNKNFYKLNYKKISKLLSKTWTLSTSYVFCSMNFYIVVQSSRHPN